MEEIVKVMLAEGIDEETIHEVLDVIEENYEIVDENLPKMIRKVHGEPEYGKGLVHGLHPDIKHTTKGGTTYSGSAYSDFIPANRSAYLFNKYADNKDKDEEQFTKSFGDSTHDNKYTPKKLKRDPDSEADGYGSLADDDQDAPGIRRVKSKGYSENAHTKKGGIKADLSTRGFNNFYSSGKTKEERDLASARRHFKALRKKEENMGKDFRRVSWKERDTIKAIKDKHKDK